MGNWQLEVAKMALYVFVPVGAFYFYHQVDYFEEELARFARKSHTKYTLEQGKMIREAIELNRKQREAQYQEQLDKYQQQQQNSQPK